MEKKTIGQFIAALRKANGMTQQEVADRLNVSNKAVSRWERDECAPDITLIPALAELLGVTCDELLKGERILCAENKVKKEPKVEKQVKVLIQREVSKYKTMMWIAVAFALAGPIVMLVLENTIYWTQDACFAMLLLFEMVAFIVETIAVSRMRDAKTDSEVFESADFVLVQKYDKCLGDASFWVYFLIIAVVLGVYINNPYLMLLPIFSSFLVWLIVCAAIYLFGKRKYVAWITGNPREERDIVEEKLFDVEKMKRMNRIQSGVILLYGVLFFFAPYFETAPEDKILELIVFAIAIALIMVNVITPIVFVIKEKEGRKDFVICGLRNIFLLPCGFFLSQIHSMGWNYENGIKPEPYDIWLWDFLIYAGIWALAIITIFTFVERLRKR